MNLSYRPNQSLRWLLLAQLCLALGTSLAKAQAAPTTSATDTPPAKPVPVETTTAARSPADEEPVVLSPFEVTTNTNGYYSANTMSGTRFNTKLDDLASSITVMTKEQMSDFGMLDINDVFLYVAGTEGTGTYTDYSLDRNGSLSDNVQLNPTQANRVRGIAPANVSLGNIETMGRVPVDPTSIESLEVSRGPNANVFGLGNPSGTVNMVPASAHLNRNHTSTELRGDNYGGSRFTLDVNQVLLKDKLAIRASAVNQEDAFERKPSGVRTERYNGMIKYQPFKYTTITGSINYYHSYGNRPNALPPRDNLSYWIASGRPTWDPVTRQVHRADGSTVGTYTANTYNGPDYFTSSYLGNDQNQMFIDQGGLEYWAAPYSTTSTTGPTTGATSYHYLQPTAQEGAVFSGTAPRSAKQYLFITTPTISDKSIYDYSSINLSAPNSFWDQTTTSNISIDQMIINTPTQTLAAQLAFMREDSERWARNLLGISNDNGQSGQLTVDINERLLDGSPNPFFLRPYIAQSKPRTTSQPQKWDTSRAQLAYRLDLTSQKNPLKWLGVLQTTAYAEYKYRVGRQYSWRDGITAASWIPAGTYVGYQSSPSGTPTNLKATQGLYRFYVGDTKGNNVDYAPSNFSYGSYPFVWGNSATGVFHNDSLTLGQVAADKTGGTLNSKTTLRTRGAVLQDHLFGDRLIVTLGARVDKTDLQFGNKGNPVNGFAPDGVNLDYSLTDGWDPIHYLNSGRTTNVQFVARPFSNTKFTDNLVNNNNSAGIRFLGELLNGTSVNYNKSDSFLPLAPAQDLFGNLLPNPTGTDKSWGLAFNLFNGKVVIRATHYDDFQRNAQNGDSSTMSQRVTRTDVAISGASLANPPINLQPNAIRWVTAQNPGWSADQVNAEVSKQMQMDQTTIDRLFLPQPPIGTTNDIHSHGTEIEVNINPSHYWTISGSVTDTQSINLNVSKSLADWIAERMPVWTSIVDPTWNTDATLWSAATVAADNAAGGNPNHLWWLHHYSATGQSPSENFQAFVNAPYGIIVAQEGKNNPQVRRYAFRAATSFQLAGVSDNKWLKKMTVGGALRWEDKGAIGYYGVQDAKGVYVSLDADRPIYDTSHTYVDMFVSYKTNLWRDKVGATFKVNVRNLGQTSHLQPVGAFPDGTVATYRIVDPQQFFFTASFDL
jgi:hypothetical protein